MITENINLTTDVKVLVNNIETQIFTMYATVSIEKGVTSLGMQIIDKQLCTDNATLVNARKEEFMVVLNNRLTEAGLITL